MFRWCVMYCGRGGGQVFALLKYSFPVSLGLISLGLCPGGEAVLAPFPTFHDNSQIWDKTAALTHCFHSCPVPSGPPEAEYAMAWTIISKQLQAPTLFDPVTPGLFSKLSSSHDSTDPILTGSCRKYNCFLRKSNATCFYCCCTEKSAGRAPLYQPHFGRVKNCATQMQQKQ